MSRTTAQAVALLLLVGCAAFASAEREDYKDREVEVEKKHHKHHGDYSKSEYRGDRHNKIDLEVTIADKTSTGSANVGSTYAWSYNMYVKTDLVGMAYLTGVVAADPIKPGIGDYVLNAQLSTMFTSGKYSGATVVAAGILTYNGTSLLPNSDTLLITAASKGLRGVEGTVEFDRNVEDTRAMSFDFTWKGSDSRKDY